MVAAGAKDGKVIAANMWGKVKTVLQMITIIFYYFAMALAPADGVGVISFTTQVLCWAVAAVTALSGCIYLCRIVPALCRQNDAAPLQRLSGRL